MSLRVCLLAALTCASLQPASLADAQPDWLSSTSATFVASSALPASRAASHRRLLNAPVTPSQARNTGAGDAVNDSLAPETQVAETPGAVNTAGDTVAESNFPRNSQAPPADGSTDGNTGEIIDNSDNDTNRKEIAAAVVAAVVVLALCMVVLCCFCCRKRRRAKAMAPANVSSSRANASAYAQESDDKQVEMQ